MRRWSVLLMLSAAILMTGTVSIAATATKEKPIKIALILPGKKDDVSWNQAMYLSGKALEKKLGDKGIVTITENVYEVADIEPALRDFASEGYDVIIGHGFQFMEPIIKLAKEFPKTNFLLGTGYKTLPNTCVYDVKLGEGGYLMGTLAALLTETNKIGVIGGCLRELTEGAVDSGTIEHITNIINANPSIHQWHRLRTRTVGREVFLDLHILVDPALNIAGAHEIAESLESALHKQITRPVNITVHIEPDIPTLRK